MQDSTLEAHKHNRSLTAGRNNTRPGIPDQPPEARRIFRLLGAQAEEPARQPRREEGPQEPAEGQREGKAPRKGPRRKLTPSRVMDDYEGPRLTVSQELARILGKKPAEAPELSTEEFPSLASASGGAGTGAAGSADYGTAATRTRPRSRSPMATAWSGAKGKHLEGGRQQVLHWPHQAKGAEPEQVVEVQTQAQSTRKRSSEDRKDQTRIAKKEEARNPKIQRLTKERDTQPKEVTAPGKKRELEAEGFKRLFPDSTQASQELSVEQGTATKDTASRTEESRPKERRIGQDGCATGHKGAGKGRRASRAAGGESPIPTHNRFEELDEGVQAQEVARKADADKEDRSKDSWDPIKRNLDIAKRKQLWKQECKSKEQAQRLEQA
jgi:hypothetical protein